MNRNSVDLLPPNFICLHKEEVGVAVRIHVCEGRKHYIFHFRERIVLFAPSFPKRGVFWGANIFEIPGLFFPAAHQKIHVTVIINICECREAPAFHHDTIKRVEALICIVLEIRMRCVTRILKVIHSRCEIGIDVQSRFSLERRFIGG